MAIKLGTEELNIAENHPLYPLMKLVAERDTLFMDEIKEKTEELESAETYIHDLELQIEALRSQVREPWEVVADKVIAAADYANMLRIPYKFGAEWINDKAFDCSSFMLNIFKFVGIKLERGALAQSKQGTEVEYKNIRKGDLMFFDINGGNPSIDHVGMYIGNGKMIQTNSPTSGINIADVKPGSTWYKCLQKIRRVIQ